MFTSGLHVLKTIQIAHRGRDFAGEVVVGQINGLKLGELPNFWRYWPR